MRRFVLSRVGYSAVSLFLLSLTIFTIVRATGDPAVLIVGPGASRDDYAAARTHWGLDQPWPAQYLAFVSNAVRGDLGPVVGLQPSRPHVDAQAEYVARGGIYQPDAPVRTGQHQAVRAWRPADDGIAVGRGWA